ncbi:hypothetical protein AGABI2DRAFT_217931 [Agaricus bisporus var. bisporus H97]|uniref:hypothetical protein n=1 Tax=Agaricus bisporus var. bisporus (strain H97 / ATCC MYA-4626 / FGSC 10389) TaxID=936046 RepID=UPI00029F56C3|nr:hypothetical protein AGABI2DRAFT_217931 [Agaricus bisporus var. bisporus H97]EKV48957.1 hypothetical protein AGABI2DRAFT_217931 [Agaricus bisporus var. bisporus H97]
MAPLPLPQPQDYPRRVRALFGGTFVIDSKNTKLVWEHQYYPTFFFPQAEVKKEYLEYNCKQDDDGGVLYDIIIGSERAPLAVTVYNSGTHAGLLKVNFASMDSWFEEDEEIFVHPKDPYHRVDVLQSSRHICVEVNGAEVANTSAPRLLFETGLPARTYIPKTHCRLNLLVYSNLRTECPYKGEAHYYNVNIQGEEFENIVWSYGSPNLECAAIRGYVAFYDEKVDVWVDGEKQARPRTKWS